MRKWLLLAWFGLAWLGFSAQATFAEEKGKGVLVELGDYQRAPKAPKADKMLWYGAFMRIGQEKDYKPGWASVQFKEKFHEWPPWGWQYLGSREPTVEIRNWVRSRQIAYAKAKA